MMPTFMIEDVKKDATDTRGKKIEDVFSKVSGLFAIYRADGDVTIQYADDPEEGKLQRKTLSQIRPLRGEIDGLVRKLMVALSEKNEANNREKLFFDRQVADALFMGLQGDIEPCRALLEGVRNAVDERLMSLGRLQVAIWTLYSTLVVFAVMTIGIYGTSVLQVGFAGTKAPVTAFVSGTHLWAAALFGALGAWLSIAIGLKNREVQPSRSWLDNFVDTALRIVVAVLSATILFSLVHIEAFSVKLGTVELNWPEVDPTKPTNWSGVHVAIILGIIAGFSERLVGNLLGTATIAERTAIKSAAMTAANPKTDERNLTGTVAQGAGESTVAVAVAAAAAAAVAAGLAGEDEHADHCLCDHPAKPGEEQEDIDLPPTTGGVATDDHEEDGR